MPRGARAGPAGGAAGRRRPRPEPQGRPGLPKLGGGHRAAVGATAVPRRAGAAGIPAPGGRSPWQQEKLPPAGKVGGRGGPEGGGSGWPPTPGRSGVGSAGWKGGVRPRSAPAAKGLMGMFAKTWVRGRGGGIELPPPLPRGLSSGPYLSLGSGLGGNEWGR